MTASVRGVLEEWPGWRAKFIGRKEEAPLAGFPTRTQAMDR